MKKHIRFISGLLTVLMVLGSISFGSILNVSAATPAADYINVAFADQLAKIATMTQMKEQNGYRLYVDPYSGEVAIQKIATGQILFTNPYDVGSTTAAFSESTKQELLSQLIVEYEDGDGTRKTMYSYTEASIRNQVIVKNIKNGIRVEYTMGRQEARRLVPRMIQKDRMETLIFENIDNAFLLGKLQSMYVLMDPDDDLLSERAVAEMKAKYPITNRMSVYIFASNASDVELDRSENTIKTYCPNYTYETLDEDHAMTEYEGTDSAPPLFRLALEYTLDDEGVEVRLPANGIRFDDTAYTLLSVTPLPYMGAISSENEGYTFMPDGSGALFEANKLQGITWNRAGDLYGPDYAYQQIGGEHQEVITLPVWGAVSYESGIKNETIVDIIEEEYVTIDEETGEEIVVPAVTETRVEQIPYNEDKGYVAIITEGDSLAEIRYENGGRLHKYAAIYAMFCPRPSDEYNLAEAIAVASNTTWRVESARKYVDSYRIKYIMLDGDDQAEAAGMTDYYETTYYGMAEAYRDHLESTGVLSRITEAYENMPLYIEALGTLETSARVLSMPVTVDTPLTTFENLITMYEELSEKGVDNINFRLTGFANGGLSSSTIPYKLKWEKAVGGESGFEDLLAYAADKNLGIFPDFDFLYIDSRSTTTFDGFSFKKHAVKTIDDRYTSKRYYDATTQSFMRNFEIAISPSVFEHFYEKFSENYSQYSPTGISVSTLGSDLNSDFDEDDPYNREDCKLFTTDLLQRISDDYGDVMVDSGNAYSFKYVDHIINMNLTSSQFFNASYSVPFIGLVLHGYINTTGTPLNEEGDINSAILRAIENGSSLYFLLAYQNTSELKKDENLSKYYSVRYDIWFDDVVEYYSILNEAIGDLQTSLITGHRFLEGERVPDPDELEADRIAAEEAAALEEERLAEEAKKAAHAAALAERKAREALEAEIASAVEDTTALAEEAAEYAAIAAEQRGVAAELAAAISAHAAALANAVAAQAQATLDVEAAQLAYDEAELALEEATTTNTSAASALKTAQSAYDKAVADETTEPDALALLEDTLTAATADADSAAAALEAATTDSADKLTALSDAELALSDADTALAEAQSAFDTAINDLSSATASAVTAAERAAAANELAIHKTEITDDATVAIMAARIAASASAAAADASAAEARLAEVYAANGIEMPEDPEDSDEPAEPMDPDGTEDPEDPENPGFMRPVEEPHSKYAVTDGTIVLVTYENGRSFILNYNGFDITVDVDGTTYTVGAYSFEVIPE